MRHELELFNIAIDQIKRTVIPIVLRWRAVLRNFLIGVICASPNYPVECGLVSLLALKKLNCWFMCLLYTFKLALSDRGCRACRFVIKDGEGHSHL